MISRRALTDALSARRVSEWTVIERDQELTLASAQRLRTEERTRWLVALHVDTPSGRGSARLELGAQDASAQELVDRALLLASAALGPPWRSALPAAPAKVELADPALITAPLERTAATTLGQLPGGSIELLRERVTVHTRQGVRIGWTETHVRARALMSVDAASMELARDARRLEDLELPALLADARADLALRASAVAPRPGACALILRADALLHGGGLGLWSVFATHASAELERQGLVRYRVGAPVVAGADQQAEPLSVASDGALDYATLSAPLSDEGDAIRRFTLVERGVASGLGLSSREAARRHTEPNGGVRNLVVAAGSWTDAPPAGRSLEVRRLRSLSIDPYTGDAALEIELAIERDGGERAITGGLIRLDLVGALAHALRSARTIHRAAYSGPASILIDGAELLV